MESNILELANELEDKLNYQFKNKEFLEEALRHRSYVGEKETTVLRNSNERLEFLGDAALDLVISDMLMKNFPADQEGLLSKKRALLVKESTLFEIANELNLSKYILLGKGEASNGGAQKPRLIASVLEALLGAIFLDSGYEVCEKVVLEHFSKRVGMLEQVGQLFIDFKSQLQILSQEKLKLVPVYIIKNEEGPDHEKFFEVEVSIHNKVLAVGKGKSKKMAEQMAAEKALKNLGAFENE